MGEIILKILRNNCHLTISQILNVFSYVCTHHFKNYNKLIMGRLNELPSWALNPRPQLRFQTNNQILRHVLTMQLPTVPKIRCKMSNSKMVIISPKRNSKMKLQSRKACLIWHYRTKKFKHLKLT